MVYFIIRAIVLQMGLDANDMKLLSAIIVALALAIPVIMERRSLKSAYKKDTRKLMADTAAPTDSAKGGER